MVYVLGLLKDFLFVVKASCAQSALSISICASLEHESLACEFVLHQASCAVDSLTEVSDMLVLIKPVRKPLHCDDLLQSSLHHLKAHEVNFGVNPVV